MLSFCEMDDTVVGRVIEFNEVISFSADDGVHIVAPRRARHAPDRRSSAVCPNIAFSSSFIVLACDKQVV
jgi:hypothetical protein